MNCLGNKIPPPIKGKELDELYVNFGDAFLHLFPTLLMNSMRYHSEREDLALMMVTCLCLFRIFALIRAGIDDSSKIAEFCIIL